MSLDTKLQPLTTWSFSPRAYPFARTKILEEATFLNSNWIWVTINRIQFLNDVFSLLYFMQFVQSYDTSHIWNLIFVLTSSRLYFLLWNTFWTELISRFAIYLGGETYISWTKVMSFSPSDIQTAEAETNRTSGDFQALVREFFTKTTFSHKDSLHHRAFFLWSTYFVQFSITWIIITILRFAGIFVLIPLYVSLLFSFPSILSMCLWIEIGFITYGVTKIGSVQEQIRLRLENVWTNYHDCAIQFQDFCRAHQGMNVSPIESNVLMSEIHMNNTKKELLIWFPQEVSQTIFSYSCDAKIVFDNWIEIPEPAVRPITLPPPPPPPPPFVPGTNPNPPVDYHQGLYDGTLVRAFLFHNQQVFTTTLKTNNVFRKELFGTKTCSYRMLVN